MDFINRARRVLAVFLLCASCREGPGPRSLTLLSFAQREKSDVFLNERLSFMFDASVDPFSITPESVSIVRASGGEGAKGSFRVDGKEISFLPDPVLDAALRQGGLLPGEEYEVRVAGFPRATALRSQDGGVLGRCRRFRFRTVDPSQLPQEFSGPFLDDRPQEFLLFVSVSTPRVGEPFVIRFTKPLRPDSVLAEHFRLTEGTFQAEGVAIPLAVQLRENRNEGVLEVRPLKEPKPEIWHRLEISDRVIDFSGKPIFLPFRTGEKPVVPVRFLPRE